ncbi:hypothetical protein PISMIDRAFT_687350 [Pisolithus microcarpus 441]|uniref:Uncharacterized protein n=1 Tax=Pisolithus microcarpus 441 TaxID=765257 RepID=A0A0C9Z642_9AGAM|nr:hypothetical protein PISMIDRAFT_687350 [Pisolithus microcarpus 441]
MGSDSDKFLWLVAHPLPTRLECRPSTKPFAPSTLMELSDSSWSLELRKTRRERLHLTSLIDKCCERAYSSISNVHLISTSHIFSITPSSRTLTPSTLLQKRPQQE